MFARNAEPSRKRSITGSLRGQIRVDEDSASCAWMTIPEWQLRKGYAPSAGNGAYIRKFRNIPIAQKNPMLGFATPLKKIRTPFQSVCPDFVGCSTESEVRWEMRLFCQSDPSRVSFSRILKNRRAVCKESCSSFDKSDAIKRMRSEIALRASPTRAVIFPASVSSKANRYSCFQLAGDAFPAAINLCDLPFGKPDPNEYAKNKSFEPVSFDR